MSRRLVSAGLVVLSVVSTLRAADYYVSVAGSDAEAGTRAKPFATLGRARDVVRTSGALGKEPVTVHILPGVYYLPETLVFAPADSGTAGAPVSYVGEAGGDVVLSGGLRLELKWEPYTNGILQAKVPAGLAIDQLFINGERQHMARYPNYDPNQRIMHGFARDAFSKERAARWADPTGGYIHAMHPAEWGDVHFRITGKKPDGSVSYEGGWQNNRGSDMHPVQRFVENIFEELDAPGEWFHDGKTATLFFYPPPGVDLGKAVVEVVRLRHLIEFKGEAGRPVRFIRVSGLTFRHAARTFMENREPLNRSDWTTYRGGAVLAEGTEDCQVADCRFDQVGGNSIFVNDYNRRFTVRGCLIEGSGANGVAFVGDAGAVRSPLTNYSQRFDYAKVDRTPGPLTENYPSDCVVDDCLITRTGSFERQTAGVQISMARNITIRHCSIYDVPRAGINICEGCWGGDIVEFCDVFDTVKETGDHGSFNSWGRDRYWHPDPKVMNREVAKEPDFPGLDMVSPNILRNSRWRCDHGWDIDLDDGSSFYEIYNNLCLNGGIKNREGYHRIVTNNIIVNNTFHPHVWLAASGDVFAHNIVMGAYRPAVMPAGKWGQEVDYNFFTGPDGDRLRFKANDCDAHSLSGDPEFVAPASGDYQVREGSPALAVGFKNFPMNQFGVQKPALRAIARRPELPEVRTPTSVAESRGAGEPRFFCQARVRDIHGLGDRSAHGLPDESGVLVMEPAGDGASAGPDLAKNDVILECNGKPVRNMADLLEIQGSAGASTLELTVMRGQGRVKVAVCDYVRVTAASAASAGAFKTVPLAAPDQVLPFKRTDARPETRNEPVAVLGDGRLAANYGPVFGNEVSSGCYKVDLGGVKPLAAVNTFSYNQGGNRGRQHFILYGSTAASDPGWNVANPSAFVPIAEVDTPADASPVYVATRVAGNHRQPLGRYRWLVWRVYPVTSIGENTAFQEFQVLPADGE